MRKVNKKSRRPLWVIKAGSQMVIEGGPMLIRSWMQQVHTLQQEYNIDVIWVTSGAIATARKTDSRAQRADETLAQKQALSAVGQPMIMNLYGVALGELSRRGAQVLLTSEDLGNRVRRENLTRTLSALLAWKCLPILNENDTVSTEEIQFGDNDRLSALVAIHMKADKLILLTDVEGLYDRDPKKLKRGQVPKLVKHLKSVPRALVGSLSPTSISGVGKGGMLSKIIAAQMASKNGIDCHLVKGDAKSVLIEIANPSSSSKAESSFPGTFIERRAR